MKVNLITPRMDSLPKKNLVAVSYKVPAPGLMRIATYCKPEIQGIDVNIYNEVAGLPDDIYDADFVGASSSVGCHTRTLYHLKKAKTHGAITLIGGPNVGHLSQQIAMNHDFIDYIVIGHGEKSLVEILNGNARQRILDNPVDIRELHSYDLSCFKSSYDASSKIPIANIEGCLKTEKFGKCSFCSIPYSEVTMRSPKQFWEQISKLHNRHGLTYFFETGDCFPIKGEYLNELVESKPSGLKDIMLHIYISPSDVLDADIEYLKRIGVVSAFVGIESFDESILRRIPKIYDPEKLILGLRKFNSEGVEMFSALVYGLPGENKKTLTKNLDGVKKLKDDSNINISLFSCFMPVPGSRIYRQILRDEATLEKYNVLGRNLAKEDAPDYPDLFLAYLSRFCPDLTPYELFEALDEACTIVGDNFNEFSPMDGAIREKLGLDSRFL